METGPPTPEEATATPGSRRWGDTPYAIFELWLAADRAIAKVLARTPQGLDEIHLLMLLRLGEYTGSDLNELPYKHLPSQARLKLMSGRAQPTISTRLTRLIDNGLVETVPPDEMPRTRITLYRLTSAGLALLDDIFAASEQDAPAP